jgi:phosphate transport system substrate-binding protein
MIVNSLLNRRYIQRILEASCVAMVLFFPATSRGQTAPDTIRIWGHGHRGRDYIQTLLTAWQDGFRKSHPDARFEDNLYGNASGLAGVYTGVADLALLDREASFIEVDAFQQATGYNPFRIPVARGSVSIPHHAPALVVYVNSANPLTHLTLEQLDGIFDADHRLGGRSYKTWGDLGLTGDWVKQPIRLYSFSIETAEVQFFERAALKGSQKFSCCLTLFHARPGLTAEQQLAAAVAKDKYGLALSSLPAPALKPIPLSASETEPAVLPTPETITAGTYPLARTVYLYANRKPGSPVPSNVAAFLDYIVSPEGQAIVSRTGGYLPLSSDLVAKAKESLQ